jgi:hypothetical protein
MDNEMLIGKPGSVPPKVGQVQASVSTAVKLTQLIAAFLACHSFLFLVYHSFLFHEWRCQRVVMSASSNLGDKGVGTIVVSHFEYADSLTPVEPCSSHTRMLNGSSSSQSPVLVNLRLKFDRACT